MADRTYIYTTGKRAPKPRSMRLRECGAGSSSASVVTSVSYSGGGESSGGTGADGFSPTISFGTEGSTLVITVTNKSGSDVYRIDLGALSGTDALREEFEECCRKMEGEVEALRATVEELKGMLNAVTFSITPTPSDATVIINGERVSSVTVARGSSVSWEVSAEGYITRSGSLTLTEDTTLEVELEREAAVHYSFTVTASPAGAAVRVSYTYDGETLTLSGVGSAAASADPGTDVVWEVSMEGYVTQEGSFTVDGDGVTVDVALKAETRTLTVNATPATALVTVRGADGTALASGAGSVTVVADYGTELFWEVSADGYTTRSGSLTLTEDTALSVELVHSETLEISSLAYADIPAGGGAVRPSVGVNAGAALAYSGDGVDPSTGEVSADSLGTTVRARTRVTTVTLTATLGDQTATRTADVYQAENALTGTTSSLSYGSVSVTGGHAYGDIPASGGTVAPTAPDYLQTATTTYTDTYSSGATAQRDVESPVTSGATLSYSGTGVNTSTGEVSADSLGTTETDRTRVTTSTVTVTLNGRSASKAADVYQAENERYAVSEETEYGDVSVTLSYAKDVPAGGGSVSPDLSYSQPYTRTTNFRYDSGATAQETSDGTLTTNGSASYTLDGSHGIARIDGSTGEVSADSLGTTVSDRRGLGTVTATVTLSRKEGTASCQVWQEANEITDISTADARLYYYDTPLTQSSRGTNEFRVAAEGGDIYIDMHIGSTVTFTSGETAQDYFVDDWSTITNTDVGVCDGFSFDPDTMVMTVTPNDTGEERGRFRITERFTVTGTSERRSYYLDFYQEADDGSAETPTVTVTIVPTPSDATVQVTVLDESGAEVESFMSYGTMRFEAPRGAVVEYLVSKSGYVSFSGVVEAWQDVVITVTLEEE